MNIQLFDTTLRDGTQSEGLSLSVEDKLKIARLLDGFGIHFIEGGWPGSNPKDVEFFRRARDARRSSTPSSRRSAARARPASAPRTTPNLKALIEAADAGGLHLRQVLDAARHQGAGDHAGGEPGDDRRQRRVPEAQRQGGGLRRRALLRRLPRRPRLRARGASRAAADAGADWITLCDTNGGSLPSFITEVVGVVQGDGADAPRDPHAQRRRHGGRQRAGRGRGRLHRRCRARSTAGASAAGTPT